MKNRISKLIPLALMISALACATAPTAAPSAVQTKEAEADTIRLTYAIPGAPPEILATAKALGLDPFGYLRPYLYTSHKDGLKYFDAEKAERNLAEITAIVSEFGWIGTDLEREARARVRDPDSYELEEVKWADGQFLTMWSWFRSHFPDLKLTEYNLAPGRPRRPFPHAEKLVIDNLDAFDISLFWKPNPNWQGAHRKILAHAVELGREHDKPVVVWIWGRYKEWNEDETVIIYSPLPPEALEQMLDLAISEGVDIVVLWSNTYGIMDWPNPTRVLAETVGRDPDYDILPEVNARMVSTMAEMVFARVK